MFGTTIRRMRVLALGGALLAPLALGACDDENPELFEIQGEGAVSGTLFYDADRDGEFDPYSGDQALSGVTVQVRERGTGQIIEETAQTTTGPQGRFTITGLPPGTHDLFIALPEEEGMVCQNPLPVSVRINEVTTLRLAGQESCLITIAEAREQPIDEPVTVRGVVTVGTGDISSSYFWLQDETAGVKIYNMPFAAEAGQYVEVQGLIEHFGGEVEISRGTVTVLGEAPLPQPTVITGAEFVSSEYQGSLVTIEGVEVTNIAVNQSGGDDVTVRAPDGSTFNVRVDYDTPTTQGTAFTVGNTYNVTGVVAPFGGAEQLYVRSNDDIEPVS